MFCPKIKSPKQTYQYHVQTTTLTKIRSKNFEDFKGKLFKSRVVSPGNRDCVLWKGNLFLLVTVYSVVKPLQNELLI